MSESPALAVRGPSPSGLRVATVTVLAAFVSVVVNFALVHLATSFDPAIAHYSHFRFSDYGTLTILGVIGAGVAWFAATRYLPNPRSTFFRVAVVAMVVLWLPDVWLYLKHEPARAVTYLVVMHLGVALVTYNALVFAAPVRGDPTDVAPRSHTPVVTDEVVSGRAPHALWLSMMTAVALEFVTGIIDMVDVPFNRASGWISHRGEAIYLVHAVLGGLLGAAAIALTFRVLRTHAHRVDRIAAVSGLCGVLIGALGGALSLSHPLRLLGMALMFVGVSVAFFGYLIATIGVNQSTATQQSNAET